MAELIDKNEGQAVLVRSGNSWKKEDTLFYDRISPCLDAVGALSSCHTLQYTKYSKEKGLFINYGSAYHKKVKLSILIWWKLSLKNFVNDIWIVWRRGCMKKLYHKKALIEQGISYLELDWFQKQFWAEENQYQYETIVV